ncbi:MAG: methyltransferase domain-containing protein [Chloroflexota bacterium]|nr:methyltransferase domain-containing protein [Anaerolineae bacterium]
MGEHWALFYDLVNKLLFSLVLTRERTIREMTVELAQVRPGEKVLEVGCGTGNLTIVAKERVGLTGEVYGIEASPEMIKVARRKAARKRVDIDLRVGLIEDIPFPDDQFDVVLSSFAISHVTDDKRKRDGLGEIRRVLKPGGRLLFVEFEPPTHPVLRGLATLVVGYLLGGHVMMQYTVRQEVPRLEAAGFIDIEAGATNHWAFAFVRGHVGRA